MSLKLRKSYQVLLFTGVFTRILNDVYALLLSAELCFMYYTLLLLSALSSLL